MEKLGIATEERDQISVEIWILIHHVEALVSAEVSDRWPLLVLINSRMQGRLISFLCHMRDCKVLYPGFFSYYYEN